MRKLFGILRLILFSVVFLSACGSGGGGGGGAADSMTVVVDGLTKTYTEGPINIAGYYDPYMEADIYPSTGRTWITLSSGVTGGATPPNVVINVWVSDHIAGVYNIAGGCAHSAATCVSYTDQGKRYDSTAASGTVTIESIGNAGQPVIGSFSAVLTLSAPPNTTMNISGTFHVMREN